jgi:DNA (cytosine-5)-methyltransferase 1
LIKVCNLYCGIGGNRKYWDNVDVTAVEINPQIAAIYQDFFPNDKMIITDAHQYLLEHYQEFDFIWSSPPCQSHSRARLWGWKNDKRVPKLYPDLKLYEEIIFLENFCQCKYVVENVSGYYEPLVEPQKIGRHYFWSNFVIPNFKHNKSDINRGNIKSWQEQIGLSLDNKVVGQRKDQILRNCVEPELGLHIFNCAFPENHKHIENYYKQEILL